MARSGSGLTGSGLSGTHLSGPGHARRAALSAFSLTDSLRERVQLLAVDRRTMYEQVQAHRDGGHLVPATLCQEIAENESSLRDALDRYADAAARR